MSQELHPDELREQLLVQQLLDGLNDELGLAVSASEDDEEATLRRLHVETLGLLPFELDPVTPSAGVEERIMASLRGQEGAEEAPSEETPSDSMAKVIMHPSSSTWTRWALPIAASLTLLMVGLSGWQFTQIEGQQQTIETLSARLSDANRSSTQLAELRDQLESTSSKLALVTAEGAEFCSLKPVGDDPMHAASRGALIVAPDRQQWYLKIEGLEPCPQGRSYQLWFVTKDGTQVSAGTFDVQSGIRVELTSETLPEGTTGVSVTLEPAGGSESPSGEQVLFGDQPMRLL